MSIRAPVLNAGILAFGFYLSALTFGYAQDEIICDFVNPPAEITENAKFEVQKNLLLLLPGFPDAIP